MCERALKFIACGGIHHILYDKDTLTNMMSVVTKASKYSSFIYCFYLLYNCMYIDSINTQINYAGLLTIKLTKIEVINYDVNVKKL